MAIIASCLNCSSNSSNSSNDYTITQYNRHVMIAIMPRLEIVSYYTFIIAKPLISFIVAKKRYSKKQQTYCAEKPPVTDAQFFIRHTEWKTERCKKYTPLYLSNQQDNQKKITTIAIFFSSLRRIMNSISGVETTVFSTLNKQPKALSQ